LSFYFKCINTYATVGTVFFACLQNDADRMRRMDGWRENNNKKNLSNFMFLIFFFIASSDSITFVVVFLYFLIICFILGKKNVKFVIRKQLKNPQSYLLHSILSDIHQLIRNEVELISKIENEKIFIFIALPDTRCILMRFFFGTQKKMSIKLFRPYKRGVVDSADGRNPS
jgi:hypothetical protein